MLGISHDDGYFIYSVYHTASFALINILLKL